MGNNSSAHSSGCVVNGCGCLLYYCLCVCTGSKMPQLCVKLMASITGLTKIVAKLEGSYSGSSRHILPADLLDHR